MYIKLALSAILSICLVGQPLIAQESTKMTKKEIAIKTAKIIGYSLGIILPSKFLSYDYKNYDLDKPWTYKNDNASFMEWLVIDPVKDTYLQYKNCNDDTWQNSLHEVFRNASLLGCMGYSTHGLYKELKPVIKALFVYLGHLAQDKENPKKQKVII